MNKKYLTFIDVFDNDYPSFLRTETHYFHSWNEANEYCLKADWSGEMYVVDRMFEPGSQKVYRSKKEFDNEQAK